MNRTVHSLSGGQRFGLIWILSASMNSWKHTFASKSVLFNLFIYFNLIYYVLAIHTLLFMFTKYFSYFLDQPPNYRMLVKIKALVDRA